MLTLSEKNISSSILIFNSPKLALFIFTSLTVLYGGNQEIISRFSPHDDYYFILRSESFDLMGSHLAPIKEYLYSFFIRIARIYGINLRTFEEICYGFALVCLWYQTSNLMKSRAAGWITVLPLTLFTYQHPVFNIATYDGLQLILTPFSFASALQIVTEKGSSRSLITAGLIAGCQVLTRPEGFLFILPPLISLFFISEISSPIPSTRLDILLFLKRVALIIVAPVLFQQGMSAINQIAFGFWAPTIMKSAEFQAGLSSLMEIQPQDNNGYNYAPFPKSSMEQAYAASPAFLMAKPFFDQNLDGNGWSKHANPHYRAMDGSISGGHFQWALLDASAYVAGPKPKAMLAYLKLVSDEIQAAFDSGKLLKRPVISTALGPEFSISNRQFWLSVSKIAAILFNFGDPLHPQLISIGADSQVESDFNRLALRRVGLLEDKSWRLSGWLIDRTLGIPDKIVLDQEALLAGVNLRLIKRPDVAKAILGLDAERGAPPLCGFELRSTEPTIGNLIVEYQDQSTLIPLNSLSSIRPSHAYEYQNIYIHVDAKTASKPPHMPTHFQIVTWLTSAVHYFFLPASLFAVIWLVISIIFKNAILYRMEQKALFLVTALAFSIVIPRLGLLAGIDSAMYPGTEPRYLSSAAFSIWFYTAFTLVGLIRCISPEGLRVSK